MCRLLLPFVDIVSLSCLVLSLHGFPSFCGHFVVAVKEGLAPGVIAQCAGPFAHPPMYQAMLSVSFLHTLSPLLPLLVISCH